MEFREPFAQGLSSGIGVKPEASINGFLYGRKHLRRWRIRVFIGIELNQPCYLWLFTWNVRLEREYVGANHGSVRAHWCELKPSAGAFCMSGQPFDFCEFPDRGQSFLEGSAIVLHETGASLELVHG